jgi:uncharacterized protein YqgC (DUF456 family)|tara:strand:- start:166 stop:432 length:267 start_codon:yes stop_codon:yes gene_type:complete
MKNKFPKLFLSLALDAVGFIPIPFFGLLWAPLAGYIMTKMYKGRKGKIAGVVSFLEELLPIDVLPTFTIMWFYTYIVYREIKEDFSKN